MGRQGAQAAFGQVGTGKDIDDTVIKAVRRQRGDLGLAKHLLEI